MGRGLRLREVAGHLHFKHWAAAAAAVAVCSSSNLGLVVE